ncbi:hypothetical protein [Achromobacter sp. AONIH1]|uniref:hypothetical protein n=1 Tax=Achromobacter sp. AONIH1 TaxID=1758194 RepID=UPI000CD19B7A|nr:hypothetical protein [Achromobacter sp. AONIH1]AUT46993.1 hypothetical protein C2U31_13930 [Achromobacter sp. AONIH1]
MAGVLSGDELLWNWARWCWSGSPVGNLPVHFSDSDEDEYRPILIDVAQGVELLHQALPQHEAMVIIAEYPQRHERFAGLDALSRMKKAQRWIKAATGVDLSDAHYKLYLGLFMEKVEREIRI